MIRLENGTNIGLQSVIVRHQKSKMTNEFFKYDFLFEKNIDKLPHEIFILALAESFETRLSTRVLYTKGT